MAFLRALAKHSQAIRELHDLRETSDVDDRNAGHSHFDLALQQVLFRRAGPRRVQAVKAWAKQWSLSAPWLQTWGTYALLRWEVGATCRDPECPHRCSSVRWGDLTEALTAALSEGRLHLLPKGATPGSFRRRYFSLDLLHDVETISPNPLLETKDEFLNRATHTWETAVATLAEQGIPASWPRQLDVHCEWLVRSHVLGQTAIEILEGRKGDSSTVHKAIRRLAQLIELPRRT
jgi:hypothetical protein